MCLFSTSVSLLTFCVKKFICSLLDSTCKGSHMALAFICLNSVGMIILDPPVTANGLVLPLFLHGVFVVFLPRLFVSISVNGQVACGFHILAPMSSAAVNVTRVCIFFKSVFGYMPGVGSDRDTASPAFYGNSVVLHSGCTNLPSHRQRVAFSPSLSSTDACSRRVDAGRPDWLWVWQCWLQSFIISDVGTASCLATCASFSGGVNIPLKVFGWVYVFKITQDI